MRSRAALRDASNPSQEKIAMKTITWSNALSVGVAEIDRQHQNLLSIFNDLVQAAENESSRSVVSEHISKLIAYIDYHFGTEETYMTRFRYPDLHSHRQEHRMFIRKVLSFRRDHAAGKDSLTEDILAFLSDWLRVHIPEVDMAYSRCFRENGLT